MCVNEINVCLDSLNSQAKITNKSENVSLYSVNYCKNMYFRANIRQISQIFMLLFCQKIALCQA